jgi:hypothetical protein
LYIHVTNPNHVFTCSLVNLIALKIYNEWFLLIFQKQTI